MMPSLADVIATRTLQIVDGAGVVGLLTAETIARWLATRLQSAGIAIGTDATRKNPGAANQSTILQIVRNRLHAAVRPNDKCRIAGRWPPRFKTALADEKHRACGQHGKNDQRHHEIHENDDLVTRPARTALRHGRDGSHSRPRRLICCSRRRLRRGGWRGTGDRSRRRRLTPAKFDRIRRIVAHVVAVLFRKSPQRNLAVNMAKLTAGKRSAVRPRSAGGRGMRWCRRSRRSLTRQRRSASAGPCSARDRWPFRARDCQDL